MLVDETKDLSFVFFCSSTKSRTQSAQVLNFPKREMLAGDCAKGASVLCLLCRRRQTILGGSQGMLPRNFFEIYTSRIAGNSLSSPPFCFFHAACQESPCYYGQPELTYRPIIHILTGESTSWRNKKIGRTRTGLNINDEMIYENGSYMNCGYEIKWSYDPRSYERNFCNCVEKPENFRTSTDTWPRDTGAELSVASKCVRLALNAGWKRPRAFSLTWPAAILAFWNERKYLHKIRIQFPED